MVWCKENGKLRLKRYNTPGTAGQALMMPPEKVNGKYPFVWYNLGGILFNGMASAFIGVCLVVATPASYLWMLSGLMFILMGLTMVVRNGIPADMGGLGNDGKNIRDMRKDPNVYEAFYIQLYAHGISSKGIRWKDVVVNGTSLENIHMQEPIDYKNGLIAGAMLEKVSYYYDLLEFEKAKQCQEEYETLAQGLNPFIKMDIHCELLYLELIGENKLSRVEELYTKEMERYLKKAKYVPAKQRVLLAYEIFYCKNKRQALKQYEYACQILNTYPLKGDAITEQMLLERLKLALDRME